MKVVFRPTIPSDIDVLGFESPWLRVRCITAEIDGKVLGVGGLGFPPDTDPIAFVCLAPDARRYPVALHRAALMTMQMARRMRLKRVLADAESGNTAAAPWLLRLGFKPMMIDGKTVFLWNG